MCNSSNKVIPQNRIQLHAAQLSGHEMKQVGSFIDLATEISIRYLLRPLAAAVGKLPVVESFLSISLTTPTTTV